MNVGNAHDLPPAKLRSAYGQENEYGVARIQSISKHSNMATMPMIPLNARKFPPRADINAGSSPSKLTVWWLETPEPISA
jgi:hypothetical protein